MHDCRAAEHAALLSVDEPAPATTAVNRTYEHLHFPSYVGYCCTFTAARTVVYHPLTLALARKQGLADYGALSTHRILRDLMRHEGGTKALSTGLVAMVLANALSESIYSGLFEFLRYELPFDSEVSRDAAAGYTADFTCRFIYTPLLLISNRQMTQTAPLLPGANPERVTTARGSNGLTTVMRDVYRAGGIPAFFKGLSATITVGCTWTAVWWPLYAQTKRFLYAYVAPSLPSKESRWGRHMPAWSTDRHDNVVINGLASLFTSASTGVLFNPFLVVRTRLQIQAGSTMASVCREVFRESGMRGFFKGTTLSVAACVVDGVLAASCYEWAKYLADTTHN